MQYEPNLESLKQHIVPNWYHNAKLGIFIHWGLYSVPAWAPLTGEFAEVTTTQGWETWFANNPYAEWYLNSLRIKGSSTHKHHIQIYGEDFSYDDFVPVFNQAIEKWNPDGWAELFRKVGARYVVLVTKHHDGFLLWPSQRTTPYRMDYKAKRDIVGELTAAVRSRGMRIGLYYSGGLDWSFDETPIKNRTSVFATVVQSREFVEYVDYHWRELIKRYAPSIMWNDIGYPAAANVLDLFAHYYNTIPDGVINDRFGQAVPGDEASTSGEIVEPPVAIHFDFTTPEYASYDRTMEQKWESTRGIGFSFGYNQNEGPDSYLSVDELVRMFVDIISKNGNLLLNVGPMADGTIPEMQRERLEGLGAWLKVNGDAIFDTRPWVVAEGSTSEGIPVRFTQQGDATYAILLDTPRGDQVTITSLRAGRNTAVYLLEREGPLDWTQDGDDLTLALPGGVAEAPAHTFKIMPQPDTDNNSRT